jgi:hypothetical protein
MINADEPHKSLISAAKADEPLQKLMIRYRSG